MSGNEGQIPLGDDYYVDLTRPTVGHYTVTEGSELSDKCPCDIEAIASYYGSKAVAEMCMRNAMSGGGPQEATIEIEIDCEGPKRRLLKGKKCGAKVVTNEVVVALGDAETQNDEPHPDEAQTDLSEIMPGVTFGSLVESCMHSPDRTMEHEGLLWSDKVLSLPGVRSTTHIAVGSNEDTAVQIDVNQSPNPFTPARIQIDLSGANDELRIEHNDVADEGGQVEIFGLDSRAELEIRATELFKKYFVRD